MKLITVIQAGALLLLAMFGAYASAHENPTTPPKLCVPALSQDDCAL
ncbi:hypothetical protein [Tropicibacter alexandrii]|nr:hypothetical protein [Tropicibacter alexandrii]